MNCIYSLACFCSDTNDILNKFSCLVCTWFQYLLYKARRHSKLHLISHSIKNLLTFICIRIPSQILQLLLKVTQICCIKMNISVFQNWQFNHKLLPSPLLLTYQTWKNILTIWWNMKVSRIQKFQFSNPLVNWEKSGSTA